MHNFYMLKILIKTFKEKRKEIMCISMNILKASSTYAYTNIHLVDKINKINAWRDIEKGGFQSTKINWKSG